MEELASCHTHEFTFFELTLKMKKNQKKKHIYMQFILPDLVNFKNKSLLLH